MTRLQCNRLLLALVTFCVARHAGAETIDFDGLARGEIVTNQFAALGVTVFADHFGDSSENVAVTFDTLFDGPVDHDLRDLRGPRFAGGNRSETVFGNILILGGDLDDDDDDDEHDHHHDYHHRSVDTLDDEGHHSDDSDDDGHHRDGVLGLVFATPVVDFAIDVIGAEPPGERGRITFFSSGSEAFVTFAELADADSSIEFTDNSANHIQTISASDLGFTSFDEVHISLDGLGGIDNVTFNTVPEPSTTLMLCTGLVGFLARRRAARRRTRAALPK